MKASASLAPARDTQRGGGVYTCVKIMCTTMLKGNFVVHTHTTQTREREKERKRERERERERDGIDKGRCIAELYTVSEESGRVLNQTSAECFLISYLCYCQ